MLSTFVSKVVADAVPPCGCWRTEKGNCSWFIWDRWEQICYEVGPACRC
ncbi:hypothetical protein [Pseudonocardia sp. TRM90224]|nr:hypothetical protein [Pseudonocardia sp. TRM90224]